MSLVNDMLRDLDQRRNKPGPERPIPLTASASPKPAAKTRWGVLAVAAVVTATVAVGLLLAPGEPAPKLAKPRQTQITVPAVTPPPAAAPEVSAPMPAVGRSELYWHADGDSWVLNLASNQPLTYTLDRVDSRDLRLQLTELRFDGVLPALPAELIQALSIQPLEQSSNLRLTSRKPASFEVVLLSKVDPYRLQIRVTEQTIETPAPKNIVQAAPATPVESAPATGAPAATRSLPVAPVRPPPQRTQAQSLPKKPRESLAQRDQQSVSDALALVRKGRTGEAIAALQSRTVVDPDALESRTLLATLLLAERRNDAAGQVVDAGLATAARHVGLRKLKARLLIGAGQAEAAADLLTVEAPGVGDDPEYHQLKGAAEQAAGRHDAASRTYHALLQSDATNPAWWVGLGISLEALQQTGQARQAYSNVLRIPQVPAALSQYARSRLQQLGG